MKTISWRFASAAFLVGHLFWLGQAIHAADPYAELLAYRWNQPRTTVMAIEAEIRAAQPGQMPVIEAKLLQVLQSPQATVEAKAWVCRTLRLAGSEQSVPALAPLLRNKELAAEAQFALRSLRGDKVDKALRGALPETQGLLKVGIVQVLGARGDRQAVPLLVPLAGDADQVIVEAALRALGQIGGEAALNALQAAQVSGSLKRARQHALLLAAESVLAGDNAPLAVATYRVLYQQADDVAVKPAALRGLVRADKSAPELTAALNSPEPELRTAAAKCVGESSDAEMSAAVLSKLGSFPADVQVTLLGLLNQPVGLAAVRAATESPSEEIRTAALAALGRIGDAASVPVLLPAAAIGTGAVRAAARTSLLALRGTSVSDALLAAAQLGEKAQRVEAIQTLAGRNAISSVPSLLKLATDPEATVRTAAIKALGILAEAKDLAALVDLLMHAQSDRDSLEGTLAQAALRVTDKDAAAVPVLAALAGATPENQVALLRVAAQLPGAKTLAALRAGIKDAHTEVQSAALRGLAEWPDATPIADLAAILRSPSSETHRVLAFRGFVRMGATLPPEQAAKSLTEAMTLSESVGEKKRVLGALAEVPHLSALDLAVKSLSDQALELEAASAVVSLAKRLQATQPDVAGRAVEKIREFCSAPEARRLADDPRFLRLAGLVNIAPRGKTSSPDGLEKDGDAGGDQAAIDGNPGTYWDETDGAKLYRLVVEFPSPERISALSIQGFAQHNFAPKDFEVLCDGQVVKKITGAIYEDNLLVLPLEEVTTRTVELKITGYYGGSPAIRELGLYQRAVRKKAEFNVLVFSKTLGFRHANIPLGAAAIRRLGEEQGFAVDATEDSAVFTPANLARYKAVVFLSVTGDVLDSAQETAFKDYVLGGGGFAAIHGALFGPSACEDKWAWYGEVCCTAFKNHSAVVPARVDMEDAQNPSTAGLPAHWPRTDEWYNFSANPRACARVLATIDETSYQGGTLGDDHPISWCKRMGRGVFWYTAMGHTDASFDEPLFLKHILGGIQLVAGVKPGDLTPRAKPTATPAQP